MQPGRKRDAEQFVPGRMKFDLVDAMAEAIEGAQVRRIAVGGKAKRDGLGFAQRGAERAKVAFRPRRAFTPHRVAQDRIAAEQAVGLERRRLVADLEHGENHPRNRPRRGALITTPSPRLSQ